MDSFSRGSLRRIILEEIALEGLEGVTLESLWVHLSKALDVCLPLSERLQENVWSFILESEQHLQFFELPEERSTVILFDRFQHTDNDLGVPLTPDECPFVRYKCVPISDGSIIGSCQWYKERRLIAFNMLKNLNLDAVKKRWVNKFIIVASQELRYNAITPENVPRPKELTPIQYCIWEAIARSRYNGETTSGAWSLTHFCKDPTIVFYIKNKLIRHGVVTYQLFNEKRNDRLTVTTLLTLPRFFPTYRSILMSMIEKLHIMLKEKPNYSMPLIEARTYFPSFERLKSFKKAMLTHLFRKIFETHSMLYADVYPNSKAKKNCSSRTVAMVKLRYPEKSIDDLFENIENDQEKTDENSDGDFHNEAHSFIDMPLKEEFYNCVYRFGNRGGSQTEIYRKLSINHLTLRQLVKKMMADGLIKSYCVDSGRQRINMYVAVECSDFRNKSVKNSLDVLQNLQCTEEPNIPHENVKLSDIPQISARIKPYKFEANSLTQRNENISQRLISRKAFAVRMIDKYCIISVLHLRRLLLEHEKEQGLKDEVCQKSMKRMLYQMSQNNIIRMYEIVLQLEENIRIYRYVTHPKINVGHTVVQHEILKLKNSMFLLLEEKRQRLLSLRRSQNRKVKSIKKGKHELKTNKNTIIQLKTHKPPKFLISRYLHEFLFYIVVELNECQTPLEINKELLFKWQVSDPSLRIDEYLGKFEPEWVNIKAYSEFISWRTFIPPLPRYSDKPAGWVYFIDAVERMPLSIFNKIFRIDKGADETLTSFLNHPIRQHYLMRQLPSDLQCKINRVQLQRVYTAVLKLLNHMGLIQISERINIKDPLVMWIYLNRRARVLDTTNSEAGYTHINSEREYTEVNFDLHSFDDIHNYWTTLQRICVYTKLGFRSKGQEKTEKNKELSFLRAVEFDEAPLHDIGHQPGDGLGAAGLSTNLFAHTFRNWSWSIHTSSKLSMKNTRTGRTVSSGLRGGNKFGRVMARKSRHPQVTSNVKRLSATVTNLANKRLKKTAPRDAIDRDALKNMRTLRVSWSKAEDELLMIGKAASAFISAPVPTLGLLTIGKSCRDAIRHSLGIYNKTTQACCRRLQFLVRQKRHIPQVPTWLHTLQTDEYLQKKYGENFLQRLSKIYTTRAEYCEALAVHYTLIMCYLFKIVHNTYDLKTKSRFILPDSLTEFQKLFLERMPVATDHDYTVYKNPETDFDLQTIVVGNVLHSSLCAMRDKTLYNLQAFEIYKNYSEEVLQCAFAKARSDGLAVAIKRKNMSLLPDHLAGPAYVLSSKYKLKLLFLRIPYAVFDAFYNYFTNALQLLFNVDNVKTLNTDSSSASLELKSPTLGQMFVICEGLSCNMWEINIKLPVNILTVDAEQTQHNVSSMDRILDHYQSIFDNAPQQEYTKVFESGTNDKESRFILPDSLTEFQKLFLERMPVATDHDYTVYKNPETDFDLQTIVVGNVLHSSLCAMRDKTLYNLQAFEIYKNYSEEVLQCAFAKARSDGLAVAIKRKNMSLLPDHLAGPAYVLSSKYKLKLLFLRIPYAVFDAFYNYFTNALQLLFNVDNVKTLNTDSSSASLELKSPTLGQMFVICEGLSCNMWEINIKLPVNILTVDAEQTQHNVSSMDRILDHYQSIFDNAPQQEYTKVFESGTNDKETRVKFHPANLSYKIHYCPYDFISKLPSRHLHFFCALDFLEKEIEINFSKLQREHDDGHIEIECPFKCIFKCDDYIAEIYRIVEDKKLILNSLTEMAPQKLLNLATSGTSMKVYNTNLLTLVRMLESYWHKKEFQMERKDLGKYPASLKSSKSIDWCQLCNDLLFFNANSDYDIDKSEEYEPTLNKEERVIRAQDVFVVNLPTIQIKVNEEQKQDQDTVYHKDKLKVPRKILEADLQRESILKKVIDESFWKYTESDMNNISAKLKNLNFTEMEIKHLKKIHNYVEKHNLGVSFSKLMHEFPYEDFLFRALKFLSSEFIIKRVGISSFMYVHKNHIRPWVVHTFNLKRLDRENLGNSTTAIKRFCKQDDQLNLEENYESKSKRRCAESQELGAERSEVRSTKRISKPVKRFDESNENESSSSNPKERNIIVMKPVPWIRLNGSINRRVLDRWLGSILSECIARNGCSAQSICKRFSFFLPVDIFFILEILCELKCISLILIEKPEINIFSTYENINEKNVPIIYDAKNTFIKSNGDATMRLSLFIGEKKYSTELI